MFVEDGRKKYCSLREVSMHCPKGNQFSEIYHEISEENQILHGKVCVESCFPLNFAFCAVFQKFYITLWTVRYRGFSSLVDLRLSHPIYCTDETSISDVNRHKTSLANIYMCLKMYCYKCTC